MELDEIKQLMSAELAQRVIHDTPVTLEKLLKARIASPLSRFKNNIKNELVMSVLFLIFPVYILVMEFGNFLMLYALPVILITLAFIFNMLNILKAIKRYENASRAINQHLKLLTQILKKFSGLYIRSTLILIPILFITALVVVHLDNLKKDPLLFQLPGGKLLTVYAIIFVTWTISMYFFTRWYVRKHYGKHLQHMLKLVDELHEVE